MASVAGGNRHVEVAADIPAAASAGHNQAEMDTVNSWTVTDGIQIARGAGSSWTVTDVRTRNVAD